MARDDGPAGSPRVESPSERLNRLLREHGPALSRLAAGYEWDPVERQDLLQDIALALWRALPAFRGESSERTFVFRIAHNRGLTHRWQRRRHTIDLEEAGHIPDHRSGPEASLVAQDRQERLAAAIRQLPDGQRAAVLLLLEGVSQRDIGDVLGIDENAVAARLSRARRKVRQLLGEEDT